MNAHAPQHAGGTHPAPCKAWLGRLPLMTLVVSAAAVALQFLPGALDAAAYDRAAIAGGEFWRLATGHLTHWNADHLVWDVVMFAVLGWVVERRSRREWLMVVGGSAAAISFWLWWCAPAVGMYRGLSGLDSALFTAVAAGALGDALRQGRKLIAAAIGALLLAFAGKIGYELASGTTIFVDSAAAGFVPLPLVHAVGGAVGAIAYVWSGSAPPMCYDWSAPIRRLHRGA